MSAKSFLSAGDLLIDPDLIAYAALETDSEGLRLRLGFGGHPGTTNSELVVGGLEARSILRWLRSKAEFLDSGLPPGGLRRSSPIALSTSCELRPDVFASRT